MDAAIEGLKGIQRTFSFYVTGFGLLALSESIRVLGSAFKLKESPPQVLGYVVQIPYISTVVGVLIGMFFIVLLLQLHVLKKTIDELEALGHSRAQVVQGIALHPWVASPLHPWKYGRWVFWGALGLGSVLIGRLAKAHLLGRLETENPALFKAQGAVLAMLFFVSLFLLWRLENTTVAIGTRPAGRAAWIGAGLAIALVVLLPSAAGDPENAVDRIAPDLSQLFDVSVSTSGGQVIVYENCRVLGTAGADPKAPQSVADLLRGYVVLETRGGNRIYVERSRVIGLAERRARRAADGTPASESTR